MTHWHLGELARAADAEVYGAPSAQLRVEAVATDSRQLPAHALFVALRGERFDGHDFVRDAVARGARAVVLEERAASALADAPVPQLVVRDTLKALGDMAAYARRQVTKPVVAVTGSNGKTTTKELIAAALGARAKVHKTAGNLNNLVGLPLQVFAWPEAAWAAVLEMGMNRPGEIARMTDIAQPDVGVVTNVGPAHLAGLGDVEGVARAKGELYAGLPERATAVVNADDAVVQNVCAPALRLRKNLRFGTAPTCDVWVKQVRPTAAGLAVTLRLLSQEVEVALPLFGRHNAMNAAAAAACAVALGLEPAAIAAGLEQVVVPGGRMRLLHSAAAQVQIIDDTYNANPASMRAGFQALRDVAQGGRKVAVLGNMLELGDAAERLHYEVGEAAAQAGIAVVLCFGPLAGKMAAGVRAAGAEAFACDSVETLMGQVLAVVKPGDWVLVKGSRSMRMERVVAALMQGAA